MKKEFKIFILNIAFLLFIFGFFYSNRKISYKITNRRDLLAENSSIRIFNTSVDSSDISNFENNSDPTVKGKVDNKNYEYHIKDGSLKLNEDLYSVKIAEDGVLLIYDSSNSLIAQSKEKPYETGSGIETFKRNGVNRGNNYIDNDNNLTEQQKYEAYAAQSEYHGVDITEYDENKFNVYSNDFKNIIFDISLKTVFLLDRKVNNSGNNVVLFKGQYLVNCDYGKYEYSDKGASKGGFGIVIPSGVTLDLNGSTIKQINDYSLNSTVDDDNYSIDKKSLDSYGNRYKIIRIISGDNITVTNGTLIGDRSERRRSLGSERGTAIYIYTSGISSNLTVSNMVLKYFSGDGIEVRKQPVEEGFLKLSEVKILNNYIYACTRQGISVENIDSMEIKGNTIYNIIGTPPSACIDFEPNGISYSIEKYVKALKYINLTEYVDNIDISNNIFNNFKTIDIIHAIKDVNIKNNTIIGRLVLGNSELINLEGNYISNNEFIKDIPEGMSFRTTSGGGEFESNEILIGNWYSQYDVKNIYWDRTKPSFVSIKNNNINIDKILFYASSLIQAENNTINANQISFLKEYESVKNVQVGGQTVACPSSKDCRKFVYQEVRENDNNEISYGEHILVKASEDNKAIEILEDNFAQQNIEKLSLGSVKLYMGDNNTIKIGGTELDSTDKQKFSNVETKKDNYSYIKITKSPNKHVYWVEECDESCENELKNTESKEKNIETVDFDPTGMEIEFYDYNVDSSGKDRLANIKFESKSKIQIGSTEYSVTPSDDKYIWNNISIGNDTYTLEVDKKLVFKIRTSDNRLSTTTMIKVVLKSDNKTYTDWRKTKLNVVLSDDKASSITPDGNEFKSNYIDLNNNLVVGQSIKDSFEVYSNYYVYNKEYFDNLIDKVPNEYVTYTIKGKTTNKSKLEASDIDSDGNVTIQASYAGLTLEQTFNIDSGLKTSNRETEKDSGFLGSTNVDKNLTREHINSIHILSSDEYKNLENKNTIFSNDRKWFVGSNDGVEYIAGYEINQVGLYDVYIAPNTTTSGIKIKANEDSSYLFSYIGYNEYCSDKKVLYGIENLDTSNVKNMEYMFNHFGQNSLETLDLGNSFSVSKVINMNHMFDSMKSNYLSVLKLGDAWTKFADSNDKIFNDFGNTLESKKTKIYVNRGVSKDAIELNNEYAEFVEKYVSSISVKTKPTKKTYIQNYENLDLTGGVIEVTYNDGDKDTISMTNRGVKTTGFNKTKLGKNEITVEYEGKQTSFEVEIVSKKVTSISVKTKPTKKTYIQNYEELDLTGGILEITYDDKSKDTMNMINNSVKSTGFDNSKIGKNEITVEYEEKTTTFEVEIVGKEIMSIRVKENPLKGLYIINKEELDLTGGILEITYNDGSTDEISMTNKNVVATGFDNSEFGEKTVVLEYAGKATEFNVEIINSDKEVVVSPNTGVKKYSIIGILIIMLGWVFTFKIAKGKKLLKK